MRDAASDGHAVLQHLVMAIRELYEGVVELLLARDREGGKALVQFLLTEAQLKHPRRPPRSPCRADHHLQA